MQEPSVLVVGVGTMGVGIAHTFLLAGSPVAVVEVDHARAEEAAAAIARAFEGGVARGKVERSYADECLRRLAWHDRIEDAPQVNLAIESVPESIELKREVLVAIEALGPDTLATNTGALSIDRIAESLARPERFIGMHFFNPVWAMPLVEVVAGERTSPDTLSVAVGAVERLGKRPIVVKDSPGFVSSRLGLVLGLEAMRMVESGVAAVSDIDAAMSLGYGHPMGPLELTDLVGLDVRLDVARHLERELGDRFTPPAILERLVAEGALGRKAGRGFYTWDGDDVVGEGEVP
jgi:3-hydroxybutyryl-CoA dehydrogenase